MRRASKAKIDDYKRRFHLVDCEVSLQYSSEPSRILGEASSNPLYKQIAIVVYPNEIKKEDPKWPNNTVESIERHEFGEAVLDLYFSKLPKSIQDRKDFCEARDRAAEHIGKIGGGPVKK